MPALTKTTEASRVNLALQVWGMLESNPGMTQKQACEIVGISTRQYRRWIAQADEVLDEFRSATMAVRRLELMRVIAAREPILAQIVRDGLNRFTDPAVRLEIKKYLDDLNDELMDRVHASDSGKADFLVGPELVDGESKFSASEVEISLKLKSPNIIDITPAGDPSQLEEGDDHPPP